MRRITQLLHAVICLRLLRVACEDIYDDDPSAGSTDPHHFSQDCPWIEKVMERVPSEHQRERGIGKWKGRNIADMPGNVGQPVCLLHRLRLLDHGWRQVNSSNLPCNPSKRASH